MDKSFGAYSTPAKSKRRNLFTILGIVFAVFFVSYLFSCDCKPPNSVCIESGKETPFAEFYSISQTYNVYKVMKKLYTKRSLYQYIEVFSTTFFGNLLVIDGDVMLTERDEQHYHEMIAHVPLNCIPDAKDVLIIGGGDGGTLREVLRHANVERVYMVEIDEEVVKTSKQFFPKVATGFTDPRVNLIFADGALWVEQQGKSGVLSFDVVLVDSTDYNMANSLFTDAFYQNVKSLLKKTGVLVFNVDSPSFALSTIRTVEGQMRKIFAHAYFYQVFQPTYLSGHYSYMFASDTVHPMKTKVDLDIWKKKNLDCYYYNTDIHYASFILPNFMRHVLRSSTTELEDRLKSQ